MNGTCGTCHIADKCAYEHKSFTTECCNYRKFVPITEEYLKEQKEKKDQEEREQKEHRKKFTDARKVLLFNVVIEWAEAHQLDRTLKSEQISQLINMLIGEDEKQQHGIFTNTITKRISIDTQIGETLLNLQTELKKVEELRQKLEKLFSAQSDMEL